MNMNMNQNILYLIKNFTIIMLKLDGISGWITFTIKYKYHGGYFEILQ